MQPLAHEPILEGCSARLSPFSPFHQAWAFAELCQLQFSNFPLQNSRLLAQFMRHAHVVRGRCRCLVLTGACDLRHASGISRTVHSLMPAARERSIRSIWTLSVLPSDHFPIWFEVMVRMDHVDRSMAPMQKQTSNRLKVCNGSSLTGERVDHLSAPARYAISAVLSTHVELVVRERCRA